MIRVCSLIRSTFGVISILSFIGVFVGIFVLKDLTPIIIGLFFVSLSLSLLFGRLAGGKKFPYGLMIILLLVGGVSIFMGRGFFLSRTIYSFNLQRDNAGNFTGNFKVPDDLVLDNSHRYTILLDLGYSFFEGGANPAILPNYNFQFKYPSGEYKQIIPLRSGGHVSRERKISSISERRLTDYSFVGEEGLYSFYFLPTRGQEHQRLNVSSVVVEIREYK